MNSNFIILLVVLLPLVFVVGLFILLVIRMATGTLPTGTTTSSSPAQADSFAPSTDSDGLLWMASNIDAGSAGNDSQNHSPVHHHSGGGDTGSNSGSDAGSGSFDAGSSSFDAGGGFSGGGDSGGSGFG